MTGTDNAKPAWEVTEMDHENGFKDLGVELRSGKAKTVRLSAPSHRVAQSLAQKWLSNAQDPAVVVQACLPAHEPANLLDKLTVISATQVQMICIELAFGASELKKKLELGRKYLELLQALRSKSATGDSTKPC